MGVTLATIHVSIGNGHAGRIRKALVRVMDNGRRVEDSNSPRGYCGLIVD
jgi:hypothetical protein